ncbi:hypothetical protein [Pseudomonas nitroreducens]|uniref:hypothetical protein n=1 Tax=Pseudomonas nitroreducens TaxID=46680 RepID=UPI00265B0699|nr:hypothetical protein [Pseudomonas nitroreducens]MCP1652281.1 hypothetical protein [Pseudomonas nitroreducens]MCP1689791.1 hypothetical protein [Pseudomonas nitroreducens]
MLNSIDDVLAHWPAEEHWPVSGVRGRVADLLQRFDDLEQLHRFWSTVRGMSFPGTYGQTPWPFSCRLAHLVFDVANPHQKLMDDIERYRFSSDSSLVESCHEELRALVALENRMVIQDPHRRFVDRVFRALGQGLQQGAKPVQLPGGDVLAAPHYAALVCDGIGSQTAPMCAVLAFSPKLLDSEVHLLRGSYPGAGGDVPLASIDLKSLLPGVKSEPDLGELARIYLTSVDGVGGYAWGDTRGADGAHGAEKLTHLVLLGYAERTSRSEPNQLGGSWPQVRVTPSGATAIHSAGVLPVLARQLSRATALLHRDDETYEFDVRSGAIVASSGQLPAVLRVDVEELQEAFPDESIGDRDYEIPEVCYLDFSGAKVMADTTFRDENNGTRPSL